MCLRRLRLGQQLVRGLRLVEDVDDVREVVFLDVFRAESHQRGLRALDDRPAHRLGALFELVALDERLAKPDEVAP